MQRKKNTEINIKNQIAILTMIALLLPPTLSTAIEIRQERYKFLMTATQDVTHETFVVTEFQSPRKIDLSNKDAPLKTFPIACHISVAHFQKDSSILSSKDANTILSDLQKCRITQDTLLITTGYTCELGPDHLNQALSLQRAKTVASFLRNHGFIVAVVQGKGSLNPISHDPLDFFKNRRVEIKIIR